MCVATPSWDWISVLGTPTKGYRKDGPYGSVIWVPFLTVTPKTQITVCQTVPNKTLLLSGNGAYDSNFDGFHPKETPAESQFSMEAVHITCLLGSLFWLTSQNDVCVQGGCLPIHTE